MATHDPLSDTVQTREHTGLWGLLTMPIYVFPWSRPKPDWRTVLHAAALPRPLAQRVSDTVRAARLWQREKIDLTRELCAHFADGLAAGRTSDELLTGFGPAKPAAKLIRRAKLRNRPLWWRSWRNSLRALGIAFLLVLAIYAVLAAMFFFPKPKLTRNFAAELNAPINAVPADQRAWPVYFHALKAIGTLPMELLDVPKDEDGNPILGNDRQPLDTWPQKPGDPRWRQAAAFIESKQDAIALIRAAAAKPTLGFPIADQMPKEYEQFSYQRAGQQPPEPSIAPSENPLMIGIMLPYLGDFRAMTRLLAVDARRAIELNDGNRFVSDIRAIAGMAHHSAELNLLINQMVRLALVSFTANIVSESLSSPALSEANLRDLAHILSTFDDATLRVTLGGEKMNLHDVVQRAYSDDGHGDGHLTHDGLKLVNSLNGFQGTSRNAYDLAAGRAVETAFGPLAIPFVASRKDLMQQAERLFALAEENGNLPLWKRTRPSAYDEVETLTASPLGRARYIFLSLLMPAFDKAMQSSEITRQHRDAALTAIAIEVYKRRHGTYPPNLETLVPGLLPAIPFDRYDGGPIKYRLIGDGSDAHPILYSIGVDRTDNGGSGPIKPGTETNMYAFRDPLYVASLVPHPGAMSNFQGDWILYDPANVAPRLPEPPPAPRPTHPRTQAAPDQN